MLYQGASLIRVACQHCHNESRFTMQGLLHDAGLGPSGCNLLCAFPSKLNCHVNALQDMELLYL